MRTQHHETRNHAARLHSKGGGSPWSPLERLLYLLAIIIVIALIWPPISSEDMNQFKADADLDVARIQAQEFACRLQDLAALHPNNDVSKLTKQQIARAISFHLDPWNRPYHYTQLKDQFEIRSAGPDRKFNTDDDITQSFPSARKR